MRFLLIAAVVFTAGCSLFGDRYRDRSLDYLRTTEQAPTLTQEGTPVPSVDRYPIPALPEAALALSSEKKDKFVTPRPQPLIVEEVDESTSFNEFSSEALNPRIENDGAGTLILRVDGSFAQAWVSTTDAIAKSSLTLTDLNRSTGTWYLEMKKTIKANDRGWWSRLWGKDKHIVETNMLKITRARQGAYLSLLTDADNLADEALTKTVLNELKELLEK